MLIRWFDNTQIPLFVLARANWNSGVLLRIILFYMSKIGRFKFTVENITTYVMQNHAELKQKNSWFDPSNIAQYLSKLVENEGLFYQPYATHGDAAYQPTDKFFVGCTKLVSYPLLVEK